MSTPKVAKYKYAWRNKVPTFTWWLKTQDTEFFAWAKTFPKIPDGDKLPWWNWVKARDTEDHKYEKQMDALWEEWKEIRQEKYYTPKTQRAAGEEIDEVTGVHKAVLIPEREINRVVPPSEELTTNLVKIDYQALINKHPTLKNMSSSDKMRIETLAKQADQEILGVLRKQVLVRRLEILNEERFQNALRREAMAKPMKFQKDTEAHMGSLGADGGVGKSDLTINIISGVERTAVRVGPKKVEGEVIDVAPA